MISVYILKKTEWRVGSAIIGQVGKNTPCFPYETWLIRKLDTNNCCLLHRIIMVLKSWNIDRYSYCCYVHIVGRMLLKCDGTRAETRFLLSAKRTSPLKSAGASVQSTTGSRGVRISGSNVGYTMFRGSVKSTDYPPYSQVSPSLPLPCVTVSHHISTGLYSIIFDIRRWNSLCHTYNVCKEHTKFWSVILYKTLKKYDVQGRIFNNYDMSEDVE